MVSRGACDVREASFSRALASGMRRKMAAASGDGLNCFMPMDRTPGEGRTCEVFMKRRGYLLSQPRLIIVVGIAYSAISFPS
jgi:hypothetical protein